MILAKEQDKGAIIILSIALVGWLVAALWPKHQTVPDPPVMPEEQYSPKKSWEARKDSIRQEDDARYARWKQERQLRYDSARQAARLFYDSCRLADSLWRDSIGWTHIAGHAKKDTVLDLNRCDTSELQLIRGIGSYTAMKIVNYREQLGGYYSPAQLTDGFFAKCRLDTLLAHFTADPTDIQTIDVNTCSLDRLQRHPYLRYTQAKAIYNLRRRQLRLASMDDLRSLPEMTEDDLKRIAPYFSFE